MYGLPILLRHGLLALCAVLFPLLSAAQALTYDWAGGFIGAGNQYVTNQVVDADGSIYIQGTAAGAMDLDPGPAVVPFNTVGTDIFLVKLNADGVFQWGYGQSGSGTEYSDVLEQLANGDLLQVFRFNGTMDMDPGAGVQMETSAGEYDMGVRRISPTGDLIWAKRIGGIGTEEPKSLCETAEGDLVLVGGFTNHTVLDPAGVLGMHAEPGASGMTQDMFMVKLDATGNYLWSVSAGGLQHDCYTRVANLPNGNLLVSGLVEYAPADVDPGPGVYTVDPGDGKHGVLLEFDGSGAVVNIREISSSDRTEITNILVDPTGQVFVLGEFQGDVSFGAGTPTLTGSYHAFLAKYGADGSFLWAKPFAATSHRSGAMSFDPQGNVLCGGWYTGTFDADPGPGIAPLVSAGGMDAFLLKVDADGNYRWAYSFGSTSGDQVRGIHVDADGALTLTGTFTGTVDMDPGPAVHEMVGQDGMEGCVMRYHEAPCAGLLYQVDAYTPVLCDQVGSIAGTVIGGVAPYTVEWNTIPPQNDPYFEFTSPGMVTVQVSDATGCSQSRTLILQGATYQAFDLLPALTLSAIRPLDPAHLWVDVVNGGCFATDTELRVVLPAHTTYTGAVPPPSTMEGDTLIWYLPQLEAAIPPLSVRVDFFAEMDTPADELLCFYAQVLPQVGDVAPANNTHTTCAYLQFSLDPNDKHVDPIGLCGAGYVPMDQVLRYTVRFQNTGNAPALRVAVMDSLSPLLDPASLRVIANSHPMVAEWMPGHVLRFVFDNIDLPDSTSNEPESHGHVVFELAPVAAIQSGDEVTNNVGIYFDYNEPVITNTVHNTYTADMPTACSEEVGVAELAHFPNIRLYPDPCTPECWIEHRDGSVLDRIVVYDASGRKVGSYAPRAQGPFRLPGQKPGLYCAQVWSSGVVEVVRFVVE